jgi:hypothetical protein
MPPGARRPPPRPPAARGRDLARPPDDEARGHDDLARRARVPVEVREEALCGDPADAVRVLRDRSDGGLHQVAGLDVVEADQRDLVLEAELLQGPDRADGDEVLAREDGSRRVREREQPARDGGGCRVVVQAEHDQGRVDVDPGRRELGDVALPPQPRRLDPVEVAEEGDPPVPERQQVAHRVAGTVDVRRHHAVRLDAARRAVDAHERRPAVDVHAQVRLVVADRRDDEPVDPAPGECGHRPQLGGGVVLQARREDRVPVLDGDPLDRTVHLRCERVGDAGHEEAERAGAAVGAAQVAGVEVRLVEQVGRGAADALGRSGGHVGLPVDDPGDRLDADPGEPRHVAHGRPSLADRRRRIV